MRRWTRSVPIIARIPRAYFLQAIVKEQLGQTAQAEEAMRTAILRARRTISPAYKLLARLQFAKRRPDLAADTLAKVVESGHARRRSVRSARPRLCRDGTRG